MTSALVSAEFAAVRLVIIALVVVMEVLFKLPIVAAAKLPLLKAIVPADKFVMTKLSTVPLSAYRAPVVKLVAIRAVPLTSRVYAGAVVAIPTLPPVVKMLPIVLLFPIAAKVPVTNATPAVIFVFKKFVEVILTAVNVPAINMFPDKLIVPPVNVVALNKLVPRVEKLPVVALIVPVVMLVATILEPVKLVLTKFAIVPVVINAPAAVSAVLDKFVIVPFATTAEDDVSDVLLKLIMSPLADVIEVLIKLFVVKDVLDKLLITALVLTKFDMVLVVASKFEAVMLDVTKLSTAKEPAVNEPVMTEFPPTYNVEFTESPP